MDFFNYQLESKHRATTENSFKNVVNLQNTFFLKSQQCATIL